MNLKKTVVASKKRPRGVLTARQFYAILAIVIVGMLYLTSKVI
jgi:hypothetical protein